MKYVCAGILCFLSLAGISQAPVKEEAAVRAVIDRLFKGMALGDSAMVHSSFSNEPAFTSMFTDKQGKPARRNEKLSQFLVAVGTPHKETWNEEIWDVKIQIDDAFAQAWCDFAFYADDKFSHCGVDAFHLHHDGTGWKIFHLADTRRKEPCKIPAEIQKKHNPLEK